MLTSYTEIKQQLLDEWDTLDPDRLHEYADSNSPVYYSDIMREWAELPSEASDHWQEIGTEITPETTIFSLMSVDLFYYYLDQFERAYQQIREEKEELELEEAN